MPIPTKTRRDELLRRYKKCGIKCRGDFQIEISSLSDFFAVFYSVLKPKEIFWFRGHSDLEYKLAPTALRYNTIKKRERALGLVSDMKRFLGMKLTRPPDLEDQLGWMQVAQHYGLPTRLLDWTQNAAVALFFACCDDPDKDGLVVILNPIQLNQAVDPKLPRIFDSDRDGLIIEPYFKLGGRVSSRGKRTIALNPTWNTDRIALQHGCFTLHGSRKFELDRTQASSLLYGGAVDA
jgi:hypothetical protein